MPKAPPSDTAATQAHPLPTALGATAAAGTLSAAWDGTGTAPANSVVSLPCGDQSTVSCQITGTWSLTTIFEGTVDNVNWRTLRANAIASDTLVTTAAANGLFILPAGMTAVRVRCSAWVSGAATVTLRATPGTSATVPVSAVGGGGGGGGGAMTVADGADVAQGTTTDIGIITDTSGTVIGFLRGAIKMWITFLSRFPAALGGTTAANSLPVTLSTDGPFVIQTGSITETAPATDIASSGLNGRLQRIAQRLSSLIGLLPAALVGGRLDVNIGASSAVVPISATSLPLPATAATDRATAAAPGSVELSDGAAFYTAAKTGQLPSALVGGRLDVNLGAALPTGANTIGAVTQASGPWTVQGAAAAAAAVSGNPVLIAGQFSGNVKILGLDTNGFFTGNQGTAGSGGASGWFVQGQSALGAALAGNPFTLGALDAGSLIRALSTAPGATGTTGTGLLGAGPCLWDLVGTTNFVKQAGDGSGRAMVVGAAAIGAAVAGNPVLIGGKDASGNAQYPQMANTSGGSTSAGTTLAVVAELYNGSGSYSPMASANVLADNGSAVTLLAQGGYVYNLANWDKVRNNVDVTHLASAARTTTQGPTNITTYNARAIYIVLDMTTVGTGSVTIKIDYIDSVSGKAINLLTGAAVTTNSTNTYKIGIGLTAAANAVAVDYLPRTIAITVTANNANSATYSVGYTLIAA